MASLAVLGFVAVFAALGDLAAPWTDEQIDRSMPGSVAEEGGPQDAI